jgi:hypothetical protein
MPAMKMVINNNQFNGYNRQPAQQTPNLNKKQGTRFALGVAMISKVNFAKSGCSSCGK